jgi:hypothetical protein
LLERHPLDPPNEVAMTARSNILRLAIIGLLIARSPRWLRTMLAYAALGALLAVVVIVLAVAAHSDTLRKLDAFSEGASGEAYREGISDWLGWDTGPP